MKKRTLMLAASTVMMGLWQSGGCTNLLPLRAVAFDLNGGAGLVLQTQPGTTAKQSLRLQFDPSGINIGRGNLQINPNAVEFTPADAGSGKGLATYQSGSLVLDVTARIAAPTALETVCDDGESYGPYRVTLNEDFTVVSISPAAINLTQTTIDLINGGDFALCLEVTSPVAGTVTIFSLVLNLGL